LTVIEVTLALAILCSLLAVSAGGFMTNLSAVHSAQRTSEGSLFLETVMQDLSAQPYDSLLAFNGNTFFEHGTEAKSNYGVTLTVFQAALDLLQVQAVVTDIRNAREIGRLTTLRSRR
jgi:hypothetical protein